MQNINGINYYLLKLKYVLLLHCKSCLYGKLENYLSRPCRKRRASSHNDGRISWFFTSCGTTWGVFLELRRGTKEASLLAPGKSSLHLSCEGGVRHCSRVTAGDGELQGPRIRRPHISPASFCCPAFLSHPITAVRKHTERTVSFPHLAISWFTFASKAPKPLNLAFYSSSTSCSLKEKEILLYVAKWMSLDVIMLRKPAVERQTRHASTYMRYLESSNLRQSRNWVPGAGIKERRWVAVQCQ